MGSIIGTIGFDTDVGCWCCPSKSLRGAGNFSGSMDRRKGIGRQKIIYGMRMPPPTRNPLAQTQVLIAVVMLLGKILFGTRPSMKWLSLESLFSSCSCSSKRDQTIGRIKNVFNRRDENPSPDPGGGEITVDGSRRLAMSCLSNGLNHRDCGSIPGAKQYQNMVFRNAKLP